MRKEVRGQSRKEYEKKLNIYKWNAHMKKCNTIEERRSSQQRNIKEKNYKTKQKQ